MDDTPSSTVLRYRAAIKRHRTMVHRCSEMSALLEAEKILLRCRSVSAIVCSGNVMIGVESGRRIYGVMGDSVF
jgi:hypothetical protein